MVKKILTGLFGGLLISLGAPLIASALGVVTVTPTNTQGWTATELRAGATYSYVTDYPQRLAKGGRGSLSDLSYV